MVHDRPDCCDFVVAALRTIRLSPANLKEGSTAGTSLSRLWRHISDDEKYSKTEFVHALNILLENGTVFATWLISSVVTKEYQGKKYVQKSRGRLRKLSFIPPGMPLDAKEWRRPKDVSSSVQYEERHVEYDLVRNIHLYVTADGLPPRVAKLAELKSTASATQVIDSMRS